MIYRIDKGFSDDIIDAKHADSWIAYNLSDSDEYMIRNGKGIKSIYTIDVSKKYLNWKMSLMDFIEFQTSLSKNILLSVSEDDINEAKVAYSNHHFNDPYLREYESKVMVHSTTSSCWKSIKGDNCLKAWNTLKKEKNSWEQFPVGEKLGDPEDFSDYIMFSNGSISSEIVVLSKENGKIIMDSHMEYTPGVRLYFDMVKIANDGLLIRDGCHFKVKDSLPLKPYLIWVADWENVGLLSPNSTPIEYTKKANECFNKVYGEKIF